MCMKKFNEFDVKFFFLNRLEIILLMFPTRLNSTGLYSQRSKLEA